MATTINIKLKGLISASKNNFKSVCLSSTSIEFFPYFSCLLSTSSLERPWSLVLSLESIFSIDI